MVRPVFFYDNFASQNNSKLKYKVYDYFKIVVLKFRAV